MSETQSVCLQVHEEVLRLFSATVSKLSAEQLAKYLQMTLQHSRKSRKCVIFQSYRLSFTQTSGATFIVCVPGTFETFRCVMEVCAGRAEA